ncbi:MAG: hypothetical protein ACO3YN_18925, partial [Rubrivivax sp.]
MSTAAVVAALVLAVTCAVGESRSAVLSTARVSGAWGMSMPVTVAHPDPVFPVAQPQQARHFTRVGRVDNAAMPDDRRAGPRSPRKKTRR